VVGRVLNTSLGMWLTGSCTGLLLAAVWLGDWPPCRVSGRHKYSTGPVPPPLPSLLFFSHVLTLSCSVMFPNMEGGFISSAGRMIAMNPEQILSRKQLKQVSVSVYCLSSVVRNAVPELMV
jgi:hypothetical protein